MFGGVFRFSIRYVICKYRRFHLLFSDLGAFYLFFSLLIVWLGLPALYWTKVARRSTLALFLELYSGDTKCAAQTLAPQGEAGSWGSLLIIRYGARVRFAVRVRLRLSHPLLYGHFLICPVYSHHLVSLWISFRGNCSKDSHIFMCLWEEGNLGASRVTILVQSFSYINYILFNVINKQYGHVQSEGQHIGEIDWFQERL